MNESMPNYTTATTIRNSQKVLESLARSGGVANFSEIEETSGVKGSVLVHHLNRLQALNVVEKETKGTYRLKYKTPLCFIFHPARSVPFAYFGLLGKKEERETPETAVAIDLLKQQGLKPSLKYVVTSPEALNSWKNLRLQYQWILCYEDEIIDVDSVKTKISPQLLSLLTNYVVIMDCTSATKPATIAYYELAQKLWIPLIYVYEETKQLKWLISKEDIQEKLTKKF